MPSTIPDHHCTTSSCNPTHCLLSSYPNIETLNAFFFQEQSITNITNNVVWEVAPVWPWALVTFCFCCYSHWYFYLLTVLIDLWFHLLFWEVHSASLASEAFFWIFGEKGSYLVVWRPANECMYEGLKIRCWYVLKSLGVSVIISMRRNWHNSC